MCARGGNFIREYWGRPEESRARCVMVGTAPVIWVSSTRENLLHLTDRLKDMIVTGGENVYSTEVENAWRLIRPYRRLR